MKKCSRCRKLHDGELKTCERCLKRGLEYQRDNKDKVKETKRKYRAENKDKIRAYNALHWRENKDRRKRSRLKRKYGISEETYLQMLKEQNGKCSICPKEAADQPGGQSSWSLSVDHNHATGKVRALLCNGCNASIGYAQESPERLRKMADYLEYHNSLDN